MKRVGDGTMASTIPQEAVADYIPAKVSVSVYHDLLSHEKMASSFWRNNEDVVFALMEHNFEYKCVFVPSGELFHCDKTSLHFDSLDIVAGIYLNSELTGRAYNQCWVWGRRRFKYFEKRQKNELRVVFHSPNKL